MLFEDRHRTLAILARLALADALDVAQLGGGSGAFGGNRRHLLVGQHRIDRNAFPLGRRLAPVPQLGEQREILGREHILVIHSLFPDA